MSLRTYTTVKIEDSGLVNSIDATQELTDGVGFTTKQLALIAKINEQIDYIVNTKTRKNYSTIITNALPYNYTYLSNFYKRVTGKTIQDTIKERRAERAKKLITEKTPLTKVWQILNYCSLAAFSNQFKAVTGTSPLAYKKSLTKNQ